MLDNIIQVIILILSAGAVWLVGRKESWSRWGYVIGLISQPFWLYSTFKNEQWGLLTLSVFYAYSWSMGIYNYWYKAKNKNNTNVQLYI